MGGPILTTSPLSNLKYMLLYIFFLPLSQITEFLDLANDGDMFFLGEEAGEVRKGDRFIQLSLDTLGIFGGTVTCQSDEVSETAAVIVVPGGRTCVEVVYS